MSQMHQERHQQKQGDFKRKRAGKRQRLAKLEALASRLAAASQVPELKVKDELDPQTFAGEIKTTSGTLSALAMKDLTLATVSATRPLLYQGKLSLVKGQKAVEVLVDSGASHVFISKDMARTLHQSAWDYNAPRMSVKLPSGQEMKTEGQGRILLQLGGWTGKVEAWILDLIGYDVILGRTWLAETDPQISF